MKRSDINSFLSMHVCSFNSQLMKNVDIKGVSCDLHLIRSNITFM